MQHPSSAEHPRYNMPNAAVFSQPHPQLHPQKMLPMADQNYIMTHGGATQVYPASTAQIRLPSGSSQYTEHSRIPRMFGMNTSEAFHIPSTFVTSSGYTMGPGRIVYNFFFGYSLL